MPKTQFALEMGMGTDLKGQDYTKAACRAVHDALHRNYLTMAQAFGFPNEKMIVDIRVGVTQPGAIDTAKVALEAPVGMVTVEAVKGGMDIDMDGQKTVVANAIVSVSFDIKIRG